MMVDELKVTGKQLFVVSNEILVDEHEVEIAVDFNFPQVKEKIMEMSMFWSGHPDKDADFKEHLDFVLRLIASEAYYIKAGNGYNDYGVAKEFDRKEGFYPLDGRHGILLKSTNFPAMDMEYLVTRRQYEYTDKFELKVPE